MSAPDPAVQVPSMQEQVRDLAVANQSLTDQVAELLMAVEHWQGYAVQIQLEKMQVLAGVRRLMEQHADLAAKGRNDGWPTLVAASRVAESLTLLLEREAES